MENMRVPEYPKDEDCPKSSSKSFRLFRHVIEMHVEEKNEGGCSSSSNEPEVYKGIFLGPKVLTKSDINSSSRWLLGREAVYSCILPFLDLLHARRFETVHITRINLVLKMLKSNSFVLTGSWNKDFVKRRNLHKSDEIVLYWDNEYCRLNFTVQNKFHV
ncbi:hypothetical protein M9H77_04636 [Catharanthus roseus]|uniref:Uncharacterized protein n=1 Tax=Catharanthus roseus TaxID=4058 RepID=A0ACC0CEK9_CATRO|nr:hypothetical protein M9H77_04636 [Catharanthus roseus]